MDATKESKAGRDVTAGQEVGLVTRACGRVVYLVS